MRQVRAIFCLEDRDGMVVISAVGGHPMSLYLVSCELSSGSEGYKKFHEQLDALRAVQILSHAWLVKHNHGKAKKLTDFLHPYVR